MADAAAIQPHDIEEQACIVDAYEWFAKYCSGIMGLLNHQTWHDLSTVDLVTTLRQTFSEKICEVEVAGTQLIRDLTGYREKPCRNWHCTNPLNCTALHRCMGDRNGTCRAIEAFRHGADAFHQDACDTVARVTRAMLIEVCRIPLELKAEIDKKLEHRRTRKPVLLQVLPDAASSGAAAVAAVAVAGEAGNVGGLRVVLAVSARNIDAPLPLGQIEPERDEGMIWDGMRPLGLIAQWLTPADASRLMRVHKCSRGSMMVLAKRMIGGATLQRLNSAFYAMPWHVSPSLRCDWLRRARLAARLPGVVKHGWTHQAVLACRSSGDNAELLASRIFGDAAIAAADAAAAADDDDDDDDDAATDDEDEDDEDDEDDENDAAAAAADDDDDDDKNEDGYDDDNDDDDDDDDEKKYGNAAADCLLSEAVTRQHEGCDEEDECDTWTTATSLATPRTVAPAAMGTMSEIPRRRAPCPGRRVSSDERSLRYDAVRSNARP